MGNHASSNGAGLRNDVSVCGNPVPEELMPQEKDRDRDMKGFCHFKHLFQVVVIPFYRLRFRHGNCCTGQESSFFFLNWFAVVERSKGKKIDMQFQLNTCFLCQFCWSWLFNSRNRFRDSFKLHAGDLCLQRVMMVSCQFFSCRGCALGCFSDVPWGVFTDPGLTSLISKWWIVYF